jgi:hypothetical protein
MDARSHVCCVGLIRSLHRFAVSYADRVSFGYASDPRLVPEPREITQLFAQEMTNLEVALAAVPARVATAAGGQGISK